MSFASGRAFRAAGEGLRGIGRILAYEEENEERRRLQREAEERGLLQYVSERGGDLGAAPNAPPKPIGAPTVGDEWMPPPTSKPSPTSASRFIELPGQRAHFVDPDVAAREEGKAGEISAAAAIGRRRELLRGARPDLTPAQIEAGAAGIPESWAVPPRAPRDETTTAHPTVQQAMNILRDRPGYAEWDARTESYRWLKPYDEVYAEALDMARGRSMRSLPPAAPAPVAPAAPASDSGGRGGWLRGFFNRLRGNASINEQQAADALGVNRMDRDAGELPPPTSTAPAATLPELPPPTGQRPPATVSGAPRQRITADQADYLRTVKGLSDAEIQRRYEIE